MRKYFVIYEEPVSHIYDLQLLPSGFPYILGKFSFLFYQCTVCTHIKAVSQCGLSAEITHNHTPPSPTPALAYRVQTSMWLHH
jgi:hypothetical protein